MTCREKLEKEFPQCVIPACLGGCVGCPQSYEYMDDPPWCYSNDETCTKCWDREIPGSERPHNTRYDDMANDFKDTFDSLVRVGFTDEHAVSFINSLIIGNGYSPYEKALRCNGKAIKRPKSKKE